MISLRHHKIMSLEVQNPARGAVLGGSSVLAVVSGVVGGVGAAGQVERAPSSSVLRLLLVSANLHTTPLRTAKCVFVPQVFRQKNEDVGKVEGF